MSKECYTKPWNYVTPVPAVAAEKGKANGKGKVHALEDDPDQQQPQQPQMQRQQSAQLGVVGAHANDKQQHEQQQKSCLTNIKPPVISSSMQCIPTAAMR